MEVDSSSNPNKIPTHNHLFPLDDGGSGGGGVARLCGWPSSRIVRVSRASGGKDRHSKVLTSKGLRDRRIRLSVSTAIEFYDLQDRLGYDQPSKAVEWLIKAASSSIAELPSLDPLFQGTESYIRNQLNHELNNSNNNSNSRDNNPNNDNNNNNVSVSKSSASSETSKGSGLSLSRSENRIRARERARDMAAKKEKENSSFTDLLTGKIHTVSNQAMDYFQMPQYNISAGENQPNHNHLPFFQDNFAPVVTTTGGGSGGSGLGLASDLNRGTLQSNLLSGLHHQQIHRFQPSSMVDGSSSTNFQFFSAPDHFPGAVFESQRLQLYGGGNHGERHSDHYRNQESENIHL